MIRFPNPGSDIPSFIRIFKILYTYFREKNYKREMFPLYFEILPQFRVLLVLWGFP